MLSIPDSYLASVKRMSEFEDVLAKLKRFRDALGDRLERLNQAIELMEKAREVVGPDELGRLAKMLPLAPFSLKEPQRKRGTLPPSNIAATVRTILLENRRPMKRGELVAELEKRQIQLAGKDRNKNLGTILWRHPNDFVHLEKLGYWLRDMPLKGVYMATDTHTTRGLAMSGTGKNNPFDEGMDAYGRGISREDCPYPKGSDQHEEWQEGWDEAKHYDTDEEVKDNI